MNLLKLVRIRKMFENCYSKVMVSEGKEPTYEETEKYNRIFQINNPRAIDLASKFLNDGEVIALPTDTVYGLACNANNPEAIQKLYAIKGREKQKPVAICIADLQSLRYWGNADHLQEELLSSLLPGAITIVLDKSSNLDNPYLNPDVRKIGIRIPKFKFIQDLCRNTVFPLALTSANRSCERSTLNINEFKDLWPQLKAVFDGGQLGLLEEQRFASTVIDLSVPNRYKILREGIAITKTLGLMKKFNILNS